MMSFDWRSDDFLRMPANAEVEQLATEQDEGECFSLKINGEVCAVIRFAQNPPWIPKFLKSLSEAGFPAMTVQEWLVVLDIAPREFLATLSVLMQCGFVARPQRTPVRAEVALA